MNDVSKFEQISRNMRKSIVRLVHRTRSPHIGSSLSCVEILVALYFKHLNNSPETAVDPDRDRFIMSKGHACPALYAVLAERGFISTGELEMFARNGGTFEQHPSRDIDRGIEVSSGSLGHGLSIGAGMALTAKLEDRPYRTYVLLSDGEMNEGSVWEAAMFSAHHGLHNLTALVDCNKIQALGFTKDIIDMEPVGEKWRSFGWNTREIDGHNVKQIFESLDSPSLEKPNAVILHTIKGKGVSFMENQLLWHYRAPDDEEYKIAIEELSR